MAVTNTHQRYVDFLWILESNIKKLIKLNLIKPSPLLIDALLQLDLEVCFLTDYYIAAIEGQSMG